MKCQHVAVTMGMKMKEGRGPRQSPSCPTLIRWLADQNCLILDWLEARMQLWASALLCL